MNFYHKESKSKKKKMFSFSGSEGKGGLASESEFFFQRTQI